MQAQMLNADDVKPPLCCNHQKTSSCLIAIGGVTRSRPSRLISIFSPFLSEDRKFNDLGVKKLLNRQLYCHSRFNST